MLFENSAEFFVRFPGSDEVQQKSVYGRDQPKKNNARA
jgi:hypothetical protein